MKALFYPDGKFNAAAISEIYHEIYFEGVYKGVLNGKRDLVIVDIGANIGATVQYFTEYAKQIYAIEPESRNYEALVKNIEFNHWNNVKPIKVALAEKDGQMDLKLISNSITNHSLSCDNYYAVEKVKAITFETLFRENNIKEADFVKLDIEGYEYIVLNGENFEKMASKIKMLEVEFHGQDLTGLLKKMEGLGYHTRKINSASTIYLFLR